MIVLDTDVLIEIFDKHSRAGNDALNTILEKRDSIATTAINFHEIMYGLLKYAKSTSEILQLPILTYTKEDSYLSAQIEMKVEKAGTPIRRTDAMIASICINNEADIFTFDIKHFRPLKVYGLNIIS